MTKHYCNHLIQIIQMKNLKCEKKLSSLLKITFSGSCPTESQINRGLKRSHNSSGFQLFPYSFSLILANALPISSTCRWSVPQHPPRTFKSSNRSARSKYNRASSRGFPASSSVASSSSAWLLQEALALMPLILPVQGYAATSKSVDKSAFNVQPPGSRIKAYQPILCYSKYFFT